MLQQIVNHFLLKFPNRRLVRLGCVQSRLNTCLERFLSLDYGLSLRLDLGGGGGSGLSFELDELTVVLRGKAAGWCTA